MSLIKVTVRILGVILALIGLALLATAAGIDILPAHTVNIWVSIVLGLIFFIVGSWIALGLPVSID